MDELSNYDLSPWLRSLQQLIDLIKEDRQDLRHCLEGKLLDGYQILANHEIELLVQVQRDLGGR